MVVAVVAAVGAAKVEGPSALHPTRMLVGRGATPALVGTLPRVASAGRTPTRAVRLATTPLRHSTLCPMQRAKFY